MPMMLWQTIAMVIVWAQKAPELNAQGLHGAGNGFPSGLYTQLAGVRFPSAPPLYQYRGNKMVNKLKSEKKCSVRGAIVKAHPTHCEKKKLW